MLVGGSREKSNIVAFPILSYAAAMNLVGLFTEQSSSFLCSKSERHN